MSRSWTRSARRLDLILRPQIFQGGGLTVRRDLRNPSAGPAPPDPIAADQFTVADVAIWAAFAVDYVARLYLAPARWRFVRSHLLDLLVLVVPFLRPLRACGCCESPASGSWPALPIAAPGPPPQLPRPAAGQRPGTQPGPGPHARLTAMGRGKLRVYPGAAPGVGKT